MRINWKLRLQNKVILYALIALAASFIYQLLAIFGIIPKVEMKQIMDLVSILLEILAGLGIIVDPTTHGIHDSEQAMGYVMPNKPELPYNYFEDCGIDDSDDEVEEEE